MSHSAADSEQTPPDLAEIQEEIEHTRAELAATVDELSDKLDVGVQARHAADRVRTALVDDDGQPRQEALVAAVVAAAAIAGVVLLLISRRGRR